MHTLFKENEIPKEINYCIENIDKLPRLDLKAPLKKDPFNNPNNSRYSDSTFHTLIVHDDGQVETKEFLDQQFLLNGDDVRELNKLIQNVNYQLRTVDTDVGPKIINELIDYHDRLLEIHNNQFLQENIPSIFDHIYQQNH